MHCETAVHAPLAQAFEFFADAANLERLTPPWLRFSIRTAMPVVMHAGREIEYRIHLYGVPIRWVSVIEVWEPGLRFVDRQLTGPYLWWRHEHRFEAIGEATRVIDDVAYRPRAAWLTGRLVERDVERIFEYRQAALNRIFRAPGD
jgi:ligand-binding SRPBCC domain-containing protein